MTDELLARGVFDVWLHRFSLNHKITTIKIMREETGLGLADTKRLVESAPCRLIAAVDGARALRVQQRLVDAEAEVELVCVGERRVCIDPANPARGDQDLVRLVRTGSLVVQEVGHLGQAGRTEQQQCASEEQATAEFQSRLDRRREMGWLVLDDEREALAAVSAREPGLERALEDDPDDESTLHVYADWLQERGDPRGELIALQLQPDPAPALQQALLDRHRGHLLGELGRMDLDLRWKHGFVRSVRVRAATAAPLLGRPAGMSELLQWLEALPAAMLLRRITVVHGVTSFVWQLARTGLPTSVRELVLGPFDDDEPGELLGDLRRLFPVVSRLEHLAIAGSWLTLGRPVLPGLRSFACRVRPMTENLLEQIRDAQWPALQRLALWLGELEPGYEEDGDDEATIAKDQATVEQRCLGPLVAGELALPELCHLQLVGSAATDALVHRLLRGGLAPRLQTLDLSDGSLTDAGAAALAAGRERLARLQRLELRGTSLTTAGRAALEAFGPVLVM